MSKSTLGLIVLAIAVANVVLAGRIFKLMRATGTAEHVESCKAQAKKLSRLSAISYVVVIAAVGVWRLLANGR